jgi:ferredoxin
MSAPTLPAPRLVVDAALCRGHRQCVFVAPELLEIADDGVSRSRFATVQPEQRTAAQDAVLFCPEGAVSLIDASGRNS